MNNYPPTSTPNIKNEYDFFNSPITSTPTIFGNSNNKSPLFSDKLDGTPKDLTSSLHLFTSSITLPDELDKGTPLGDSLKPVSISAFTKNQQDIHQTPTISPNSGPFDVGSLNQQHMPETVLPPMQEFSNFRNSHLDTTNSSGSNNLYNYFNFSGTPSNMSNNNASVTASSVIQPPPMFSMPKTISIQHNGTIAGVPFNAWQSSNPNVIMPFIEPHVVYSNSNSNGTPTSLQLSNNDSTGNESYHSGSNHESTTYPKGKFMEVIKGWTNDDSPEEFGGKDNRKHLTAHCIQVQVSDLIEKYTDTKGKKFMIKCILLGYKRFEKEELDTLSEKEVILRANAEIEEVVFDDLVVKHTSHSNGQKLFLRFKLFILDTNTKQEQLIDEMDTTSFKTVTKRAIIKRENQRRIEQSQQKSKGTKIIDIIPKQIVPNSCELVRIVLEQMPEKVKLQSIIVKFGDTKVKRIHTAKDNLIIVETQKQSESGPLPVSVSLDNGSTYIQSNIQVSFMFPKPEDLSTAFPEITPKSRSYIINYLSKLSTSKSTTNNNEMNENDKRELNNTSSSEPVKKKKK
ncbi:hypothetical protein ABK040_008246 [Willaertia magna]